MERSSFTLARAARAGLSCLLAATLACSVPGGWALGAASAAADEPPVTIAEKRAAEEGAATEAVPDEERDASPVDGAEGAEGEGAVSADGDSPTASDVPDEAAVADEADGQPVADGDAMDPAAIVASADGESSDFRADQIVVMYERGASAGQRAAVAGLLGADGGSDAVSFASGEAVLIEIDDGTSVEEAVAEVQAQEGVKYAVPNYVARLFEKGSGVEEANAAPAMASAKDPYAADQWYLDAVRASEAWEALPNRGTNAPVRVAVLDTGASLSHPDLANTVNRSLSREVVWLAADHSRYDLRPLRGDGYTNGSASMAIPSTHGTHVAGIIAAQANNGGSLGVASGGATANANKLVDLVAVDIFSENVYVNGSLEPNATLYDVLVGLEYARDIGCQVVNMSLGFIESTGDLADFMNEVCTELTRDEDMVLVCAAGNEDTAVPSYPAACDDAIGVISVSKRGCIPPNSPTYGSKTWETDGYMRSDFSNYGSWCDIAAPGEHILSTVLEDDKVTNGYGYLSGTSMACPVVAASAALVRAARPDFCAADVRTVLCETAKDVNTAGKDVESGYGVVDAAKAVAAARDKKFSGWRTDRGVTRYYGGDGQPVKWSQKIDDQWYYFDGSGAMQTGWVTWKNGTKSYFDWDGHALTGWRSFNGVKYYFDPATAISKRWSQKIDGQWYYFDGKSVMQKGWVTWKDGTKSYFHPDAKGHAAALLGWRSFNGVKYYFDEATGISKRWSQKLGGQWYYFDSASRMKRGWVTWGNGSKSYFDWDGHALTGWRSFNGVKYYFDPATAMSLRWSQKLGGQWYYFDSASRMKRGWVTWSNGSKSFFDWDGRALTGWRSFNGVKYYFSPSTAQSLRWSQTIGGYWYYFDGKSVMQKGWISWKDGTKSYFDGNGRALSGWHVIGGKRYYFDPTTYKTTGPVSAERPNVARTVYWVAGGEVYHTTRDCVSLKRSKSILSGTIAQSGKKRVCSNCG